MEQNNGAKTQTCKRKRFCDICNKTILGSLYKFNSHLYQHGVIAARFKCHYCAKEYFRKDVYKRHIEVHTGRAKRYYICDYCDRDFVDKRNLISHLRIHDDCNFKSTKYSCMACGVNYCEERLLKYHIRKEHFNLQPKELVVDRKPLNETWVEKVMETDVCVQMTKVNNNVITIEKCNTIKTEGMNNVNNEKCIHTGSKGLITGAINQNIIIDESIKFTNYMNSVLASKDKSQYSKAVCDYCNKEMLKKSLQNHIRERHLKLRKFKCNVCKRGFNRHYQMINHLCGQFQRRRRSKVTLAPTAVCKI